METPDNKLKPRNILLVIHVSSYTHALQDRICRIMELHDKVMIIYDKSMEDAITALGGLDVHFLRHEKEYEKGVAIQAAARRALDLGMTHIINIDADSGYDPVNISRFVQAIEQDPDIILIGRRDLKTRIVSGFGRMLCNFWFRLQTGRAIKDVQSYFRAYPLIIFDVLKFKEKRSSFETEVLVKSVWAGMDFKEIDVAFSDPVGVGKKPFFQRFIDGLQISFLNVKLTMRSVAPVPHRKIIAGEKNNEKISVFRLVGSIKALLTENSSPGQLAIAGAMGMFLGVLPLIGFHTIAILFTASFFRLNKVMAISTSQLCTPPLVPAICIELGYFFRNGRFLTEFSLETIGYQGLDRLWEWLIGSLLLAPALAFVVGAIIFFTAVFIRLKMNRV